MLLLLDAYHLGDPLFVTGLARDLAARGEGAVLVHGSVERGERALESLGALPTAEDGAWTVADDDQAAAVERATRDLNREIVHELNEAGVAAIRVIGADRGLLKQEGEAVIASKASWLGGLVEQGVVAVVAALVEPLGSGPLCEVDAAAAAAALADVLGQPVTVLLRVRATEAGPKLSLANAGKHVGNPEAVGRLLGYRAETRGVEPAALRERGEVEGISIVE